MYTWWKLDCWGSITHYQVVLKHAWTKNVRVEWSEWRGVSPISWNKAQRRRNCRFAVLDLGPVPGGEQQSSQGSTRRSLHELHFHHPSKCPDFDFCISTITTSNCGSSSSLRLSRRPLHHFRDPFCRSLCSVFIPDYLDPRTSASLQPGHNSQHCNPAQAVKPSPSMMLMA